MFREVGWYSRNRMRIETTVNTIVGSETRAIHDMHKVLIIGIIHGRDNQLNLGILVTQMSIGTTDRNGTREIEILGLQTEDTRTIGISHVIVIHGARWHAGFGIVMVGRWIVTLLIT